MTVGKGGRIGGEGRGNRGGGRVGRGGGEWAEGGVGWARGPGHGFQIFLSPARPDPLIGPKRQTRLGLRPNFFGSGGPARWRPL